MAERRLVLDPEPVDTLADHERFGGGDGLRAAARLGPAAVIEDVQAAGLRGRGGAGFPTGVKWATVAESRAAEMPSVVVVNAAEGEPGSFKDRLLLRRNPYKVLEGALIAAGAVGADLVVVATKAKFGREVERLRGAIDEMRDAGWTGGVEVRVFEGPDSYLYGEETALLEAVDGRPPFPRVAPPFRHGADELGSARGDVADLRMAAPGDASAAPPTLVNNVETLAHVPGLVADGPDAYRSTGTEASPGTVLCTVSGQVRRNTVAEVSMGTPLRLVLEEMGEGPFQGHELTAAMSGVANAIVPARLFDAPVSYEGMQEIGSGLGAAGFIVFDDTNDLVAVAQGVSRFLAIESCGQCHPCKKDGLAISKLLAGLRDSTASDFDLTALSEAVDNVIEGARCYLAQQHQTVVRSMLELFPELVEVHLRGEVGAAEPELIAPIADLEGGRATLDDSILAKQPDWSFDDSDSGKTPVERLGHEPGAVGELP